MEKRTEYTLIAAALVASALVGAAVGITAQQPLEPVAEPQPVVTVTLPPAAPEVVVMDATVSGAKLNNHVGG